MASCFLVAVLTSAVAPMLFVIVDCVFPTFSRTWVFVRESFNAPRQYKSIKRSALAVFFFFFFFLIPFWFLVSFPFSSKVIYKFVIIQFYFLKCPASCPLILLRRSSPSATLFPTQILIGTRATTQPITRNRTSPSEKRSVNG